MVTAGKKLYRMALRYVSVSFTVMAMLIAQGVAVPIRAAADSEATFTIAVVPDTQQEVLSDTNAALLSSRYQWLSDNQQALNLKYIAHVGDVVNWGVAEPAQFDRASAATSILDDSGIQYGYAIGNHDTAAVAVGGSAAPGDVHTNLRDTAAYNQHFPVSRFDGVEGVFEAGKVDNMYQTFTAGGTQWLVLTHELWPRQAVVDWAKQVVAAHADYNVIVNTHAFIDNDGALPTTGNYGDVNAQQEWDQFVSQYSNIKMVLSGHYGPQSGVGGYAYQEATGVNGNKVAEVMTAYHSSYQNHVRLLTIDAAAGTISSSVYVPMSLNGSYPTGYITDGASNFSAATMAFVGGSSYTELLPDPGFESGAGGWKAFKVGTLSNVSSPVRSGNSALRVDAVASTPDLVGLTHNTVVSNSVAGQRYTAQCYVRPTGSGLNVQMRLLEYTQNYSSVINLGNTAIPSLPTDAWTLVSFTGTANESGKRIIPQIYSTNETTNTGSLVYDDCSMWAQVAEVPVLTVPSAPTNVTAVAGNGAATVSFTAPSSDGGAPVTGYTVTVAPGGAQVTGAASPIAVTGLANGTAYTFTVTAHNAVGASPVSSPSNVVTPTSVTELLSDPGFESGAGGWQAFKVGALANVSSPVRSGNNALRVDAVASTANLVGLMHNSVIRNSVAGQRYTAQCYVRPTGSGLNVQIRFLEYTQNYSSVINLGSTVVANLPTDTWTLVSFTGTANESGKRIIPQIYSTNETTRTGSLIYDDCSVYAN